MRFQVGEIPNGREAPPDRRITDRLIAVLAIVAFLPVATWWGLRLADAPAEGWFEGRTTFGVGADFIVFHTAGGLVADGNPEMLYDNEAFQRALVENAGKAAPANAWYANPPAFALLVAPLSGLHWQTGWVVWTAMGFAALGLALNLLEAQRKAVTFGVCLLSMPAYIAITGGQGSFLWLAVFAGIAWALARGRLKLGGAIAGSLILKPTLAVGLAIWWALDRERRPALWAAMVAASSVVLATIPFVGSQWLEYPAAAARFARRHAATDVQWAQFSPWSFYNLLIPGAPTLSYLLGIVTAALGVAAFVAFFRRHRDDWRLLFAAAVVLTLWVSPHVLIYEWVMLIAPVLILLRHRPEMARTWLLIGAWLGLAAMAGVLITSAHPDEGGRAFQVAVPSLAIATIWAAKLLNQPAEPARPST